MHPSSTGESLKPRGLIVIDDAWPVTDALCLEFADLYAAKPTQRHRITYARMRVSPVLSDGMSLSNVDFRMLDTTGADGKRALYEAMDIEDAEIHHTLILQEKSAMQFFYEGLSDPAFRERLFSVFGVLAVDYALGISVYGTEVLREAGDGILRFLISANAAEHLPPDHDDVCDVRINKCAVKLSTLAKELVVDGVKEAG
jgi:hypothetical protein